MRIGLFGGSFNPVHTGHLIVIDQALDQLDLDKLIVMPAACNPLKMNATDMASTEHRLNMLKLVISHPRVEVSDMEIKRGAPSYTIDTVRELKKNNEIVLIVGGDSYDTLPRWHKIEELSKLVIFGVAERNINAQRDAHIQEHRAYTSKEMCLIKTTSIDIPTFDTSGTEVRGRIKGGRSVRYLIPEAVEKYIRTNGLYLTSK